MDDAKKKAGVPHSLSRKEEKANKRNTGKKRRQLGDKEIRRSATMEDLSLLNQMLKDLEDKKAADQPPPPPDPFAKAEEVARELGLTETLSDRDVARLNALIHYYVDGWEGFNRNDPYDRSVMKAIQALQHAELHALSPQQTQLADMILNYGADINNLELGLHEGTDVPNPKSDMARIAKHYKGSKKSKEELRKAIGNDLEMLEYSPEEVSEMVPKILAMCCPE